MKTVRTITLVPLLVLLAACGGAGDSATVPKAEPAEANSADIGDYVIHFSAQTTDQLSPEVARAYGILRSNNRAMLNVSIVRKSDSQSVGGTVTVETVNLTGQLKNITMRRIEEPGETAAIYYIGETPVANRETLIFDIKVKPDGVSTSSDVRFKREFYTDS